MSNKKKTARKEKAPPAAASASTWGAGQWMMLIGIGIVGLALGGMAWRYLNPPEKPVVVAPTNASETGSSGILVAGP